MNTLPPPSGNPVPNFPASLAGEHRLMLFPALCMLPVAAGVVFVIFFNTVAVSVALLGLLATVSAFVWLDRAEPEPRIHVVNALFWGMGPSILVALLVNTTVARFFGEDIAAVVAAPIIEELAKVSGIVLFARKKIVNSALDGVVYAGFISLGFAAVENVTYYSTAVDPVSLAGIVVLRGLLTPFAHPFFTIWAGLFIGKACREHMRALKQASAQSPSGVRPGSEEAVKWSVIRPAALKGLALGVASHALWNGTALLATSYVLPLTAFNVVLFVVMVRKLLGMRRRETETIRANANFFALSMNINPSELSVYGDPKLVRKYRKSLRLDQRRAFDDRYAYMVSLLQDVPPPSGR